MKTVIALLTLPVVLWASFVIAAARDASVLGAKPIDSTECVANVYKQTADYLIAVSSCAPVSGKTVLQVEQDLP